MNAYLSLQKDHPLLVNYVQRAILIYPPTHYWQSSDLIKVPFNIIYPFAAVFVTSQ